MFSSLRRFFSSLQSPPAASSPAEAAYRMSRGENVRYPDPEVRFIWGVNHPDWPEAAVITAPWIGESRDYVAWDRAAEECKAILNGTVAAWGIVERDEQDRLTVVDWHLYASEEAANAGIVLLTPIIPHRRLEAAKVYIVVRERER